MSDEQNTPQRDNIMQQTSMQEGMQEAAMSPELRNLSDAERSGSDADKTDALNSARNEVERKLDMAKAELAAVQEDAQRRGDPAPQLSVNLDMKTGSMDARELAQAEQSISQDQQTINGAQGQKMLRDVGEAVGLLAGLNLIMKDVPDQQSGLLPVDANLPGQQKDKDVSPAMPM